MAHLCILSKDLRVRNVLGGDPVSNDGEPISEANRDRIFDAFFTTRRDTGGTGMGLAIVRAIMASHGGSIRLKPTDQGAAFELQFPAA